MIETSSCCGARLLTHSGNEGTSYYMCALCEKPCDVKLTGTVSYGVCLHPHIARIIVPRVKLWGLWLGEEEQPVCLDCKKLNPWTIYPYEATPENKILGRARRCIAANDYIYQRDLV